MRTFSAVYKGDRVVELFEDVTFPRGMAVLVVVPEQDNEGALRSQLQSVAEITFARLWDNEEDEVWNEYL